MMPNGIICMEFYGKDLIAAEDMNYGITTSTTAFEGCGVRFIRRFTVHGICTVKADSSGKALIFVKSQRSVSDDKN